MTLLSVDRLALSFGGLRALDGVSFQVQRGQVFTVIGPNGAGKSTTLNLISGHHRPSAGAIVFDGQPLTGLGPHRVARAGIARTFQHIELFGDGTVLQSLLLGREIHRRTSWVQELLFLPPVAQQERAFREQAEAILELLQLQPHAHASVSSLPYGLRKVVELGRALALRPKLLLLDEPSSGLNDAETERIASWITRLRDTQGITVLMVEHDMNLVTAVSDHVLVLDAGRVIADGTAAAVQTNPAVIRAYLGD